MSEEYDVRAGYFMNGEEASGGKWQNGKFPYGTLLHLRRVVHCLGSLGGTEGLLQDYVRIESWWSTGNYEYMNLKRPFWDMTDTMLQQLFGLGKLVCVYPNQKVHLSTPIVSAIPRKG